MSEREIWNRLAGSYDRSVRLFDRSYPEIRRRLAIDLTDASRVLEIAAGTGQFSVALADRTGRELTCTDVSPAMVEALARRLTAVQPAATVTTRVASAYALPFSEAHFDAVFCANALHVMETPRLALAEFRRVLRPQGRLIVPTFCHGIDRRRRWLSRLLSVVSPFVAHSRFTPATLSALVEASGFRITDQALLPGVFPVLYVNAVPA